MIYKKDWALISNETKDEEWYNIALSYRTIWSNLVDDKDFINKWLKDKEFTEFDEMISNTIHEGNRASGNLYHYCEDKKEQLVWQTTNFLIYSCQIILAIYKIFSLQPKHLFYKRKEV